MKKAIWLTLFISVFIFITAVADASPKTRLIIGSTNPLITGPAYLEDPSIFDVIDIKVFESHSDLRQAFAGGEVDCIIDFQTDQALLNDNIDCRALTFFAASYGDVGIVTLDKSLSGVPDLIGRSIGVEAGSAAEYFLEWISDLQEFQPDDIHLSYRNNKQLSWLLQNGIVDAIVLEEPWLTNTVSGISGVRVICSTANYRPVLFYVLVTNPKMPNKQKQLLEDLYVTYLNGTDLVKDWPQYLNNVAKAMSISPQEAYKYSKLTFFNTASVISHGFQSQDQFSSFVEAALLTWKSKNYILIDSNWIIVDKMLVNAGKDLGETVAPFPRPWSGESLEIMRRVKPIQFDLGQAILTPEDKRMLDSLALEIRSNCVDFAIEIEGYTDDIGTEDFNRKLSESRAQVVALYLADKLDLDPARVNWKGMGIAGKGAENRKTVIRVIQTLVSQS